MGATLTKNSLSIQITKISTHVANAMLQSIFFTLILFSRVEHKENHCEHFYALYSAKTGEVEKEMYLVKLSLS